MTCLRGKFLIAGRRLRDSNFYKTVVLIVEHGAEGAMGLVVNRPSSIRVADALAEYFELAGREDFVFLGGPVEPAALFILHDGAEFNEREQNVVEGLYVGSSPASFERIMKSASSDEADLWFRIYCGCAGWAPGQLEGELERGDWYLSDATQEALLDVDPDELWDAQMSGVGHATRIGLDTPANPEWN